MSVLQYSSAARERCFTLDNCSYCEQRRQSAVVHVSPKPPKDAAQPIEGKRFFDDGRRVPRSDRPLARIGPPLRFPVLLAITPCPSDPPRAFPGASAARRPALIGVRASGLPSPVARHPPIRRPPARLPPRGLADLRPASMSPASRDQEERGAAEVVPSVSGSPGRQLSQKTGCTCRRRRLPALCVPQETGRRLPLRALPRGSRHRARTEAPGRHRRGRHRRVRRPAATRPQGEQSRLRRIALERKAGASTLGGILVPAP